VPKMMQGFEARKASLVINLMEGEGYPVQYEKGLDGMELSEVGGQSRKPDEALLWTPPG
jgi:hypothetical protein